MREHDGEEANAGEETEGDDRFRTNSSLEECKENWSSSAGSGQPRKKESEKESGDSERCKTAAVRPLGGSPQLFLPAALYVARIKGSKSRNPHKQRDIDR